MDEAAHIAAAAAAPDDPYAALNDHLHGQASGRPTDITARREEAMCSCGAGHGSLEGHMDWCDFLIGGSEGEA